MRRLLIAAAAVLFGTLAALAQSTVTDQTPIPFTGGNASESLLQSFAVPGGTVDCVFAKPAGQPTTAPVPLGAGCAFVPGGGGSVIRYLPLTDVKTDTGLPMITATAATTLPGIARTAGTSMYLTGVATSGASTATTKMLWEFNLPSTYVAGANIPLLVNCAVPTATDVTASTTTMTVAAYTEINGVEAALTVSAAQQIPITTAATLTFTLTGAASGLVPGSHVSIELTMAVTTTAGGASSGQVNSVAYQG
jgi:hypothetical protein